MYVCMYPVNGRSAALSVVEEGLTVKGGLIGGDLKAFTERHVS